MCWAVELSVGGPVYCTPGTAVCEGCLLALECWGGGLLWLVGENRLQGNEWGRGDYQSFLFMALELT